MKPLVAAAFRTALVLAVVTASASIALAQLPESDMVIDPDRVAIVITDPQNDFLSPEGVAWPLVGESVTETTQSRTSKRC